MLDTAAKVIADEIRRMVEAAVAGDAKAITRAQMSIEFALKEVVEGVRDIAESAGGGGY